MTTDATRGPIETSALDEGDPRSGDVSLPDICRQVGTEQLPPLDALEFSADCEGPSSSPPDSAPAPAPRSCPGCGVTFTPENDQRRHCGPACKQRVKRRRARAAQPAAPPRPSTPCLDCGTELRQKPVGSGLKRCAGCRALRAHDRAQQRRRAENAALLDVDAQEPFAPGANGWRRLLARWSR